MLQKDMRRIKARVESIEEVSKGFSLLGFKSVYLAKHSLPGQFLHIKIDSDSIILRRPFSIHKIEGSLVYILFKHRGQGTTLLSKYKRGGILDAVGPLGSHFVFQTERDTYNLNILIGAGIGAAPLIFLAQRINGISLSDKPSLLALLGAKTKSEIVCGSDFKRLGCTVKVSTEDGSQGFKGKITDLVKKQLSGANHKAQINMYACGPEAMFLPLSNVLKKYPDIKCQVSLEQFMGCGIGICHGCAVKMKKGYKLVCEDGPVFDLKDVF